MIYAVISDIHSNLAALQKVLDYLQDRPIDAIICLGDVVGYGPRPNECVELVRKHCRICLMGNHDHAVIGKTDTYYFNQYAREAVSWTQRKLSLYNKGYLEKLPFEYRENDLLFVHSTPIHPEEWHYILSEYEAKYYLKKLEEKICFVGHSHIPGIFSLHNGSFYREEVDLDLEKDKYIINVGSVGQPRDNDPRACFVIYDTSRQFLEYIRLEYPVEQTYEEIIANKLPPFLAVRLLRGY